MMNLNFIKIITHALILTVTIHQAYAVISAEQMESYFSCKNPHEINPETFLEELTFENAELAQVIRENNVLKGKCTPLMIAHKINPDWLQVLFAIKSPEMDIVRDLHARVTQRVHNQSELIAVPTHAANVIQRQVDRILGSLQQILGFASKEDFEKHCDNTYFMKTFLHSPIDTAGNSVLNYAIYYQDKTFQAILNMYPATQSNLEFKKPTQPLE